MKNKLRSWVVLVAMIIVFITINGCDDARWDKVHRAQLKELTGRDLLAPLEILDTSRVMVVDGCQYYYWQCAYGGWSYMHKGSCNNPIHCYNSNTIIK